MTTCLGSMPSEFRYLATAAPFERSILGAVIGRGWLTAPAAPISTIASTRALTSKTPGFLSILSSVPSAVSPAFIQHPLRKEHPTNGSIAPAETGSVLRGVYVRRDDCRGPARDEAVRPGVRRLPAGRRRRFRRLDGRMKASRAAWPGWGGVYRLGRETLARY